MLHRSKEKKMADEETKQWASIKVEERGLCLCDGCLFMACLLFFFFFKLDGSLERIRNTHKKKGAGGPAPRRSKVSPYLLNLQQLTLMMALCWKLGEEEKKNHLYPKRERVVVFRSLQHLSMSRRRRTYIAHFSSFFFYSHLVVCEDWQSIDGNGNLHHRVKRSPPPPCCSYLWAMFFFLRRFALDGLRQNSSSSSRILHPDLCDLPAAVYNCSASFVSTSSINCVTCQRQLEKSEWVSEFSTTIRPFVWASSPPRRVEGEALANSLA